MASVVRARPSSSAISPKISPSLIKLSIALRPSADETLIYDFCRELLYDKDVSDATYEAALARFGERTVVDMICTAGYFSFVSLVLNTKRYPIPATATPLAPLTAPPE